VIRWLRQQFRYFFGFTKTEANGAIIIIAIMILVTFLPMANRYYQSNRTVDVKIQLNLDSIRQQMNEQLLFDSAEEKVNRHISDFNPNEVTFGALRSYGLSDEVSNRWLKYLQAGGTFKGKEDVKKIYGLTNEDYLRLQDYMVIPPILPPEKVIVREREPVEEVIAIVQFDINLVDTLELEKIRGIGKVLSFRIIRFRESLGGFVKLDQLDEVYGIEDYALVNLKETAIITDEFLPIQLNVNKFSIEEIAKHPYVGFQEAKVIVAYRDQHGNFENIGDLLKIHTIDSTWLNRVLPYLSN
jgi:competence protein ComEA